MTSAPCAWNTLARLSPTAAQRTPPMWMGPVGFAETNSRLIVTPSYRVPRPKASPCSTIDLREGAGGSRIQSDVDEAGAGNLDGCDTLDRLEPRCEVCGELARVQSERLGQLHRDVRGPVAVVAVLGALERHVRQLDRGGWNDASALERSVHDGEQLG